MNIIIICSCGLHYEFEADPMGGNPPLQAQCPQCGSDGTEAANQAIANFQSNAATRKKRLTIIWALLVGALAVVASITLPYFNFKEARKKAPSSAFARSVKPGIEESNTLTHDAGAASTKSATLPSASVSTPPRILNLKSGEIVRNPVILVEGTVSGETLTVEGAQQSDATVFRNEFRALVELKPGSNTLVFADDLGQRFSVPVVYKIPTPIHRIRPILLIPKDHPAATNRDAFFDYKNRLTTGLKLMQCLSAESMAKNGFGRKTFSYETMPDGEIAVKVIHLPLPTSQYAGKARDPNYQFISATLRKAGIWVTNQTVKHWVFPLYSGGGYYGGGPQAVAGFETLEFWPRSVGETMKALDNNQMAFYEPAYGKRPIHAMIAIYMGGSLHELGHCFGLWHPGGSTNIMQRGYDDLCNNFLLFHDVNGEKVAVSKAKIADWGQQSILLNYNSWFNSDSNSYTSQPPQINVRNDEISIVASNPIAVLCLTSSNGEFSIYEEVGGQQSKNLSRSLTQLRRQVGTSNFRLTVVDMGGNSSSKEFK